MRYFIFLSYMGKAYCGWQRQTDAPTIQQTLEQRLSALLRQTIEVVGAGRTDTGVNASSYVAHFDYEGSIDRPEQVVYKLNRMLPRDISVSKVVAVKAEAHARFDARQREYTYYISTRKCAFTHDLVWQYYVDLDLEKMNRAARILLDVDDFTTFAKLNSNNKTNICHISYAQWDVMPDGTLRFIIRADRFLRNMVRAIVGTLVDVGKGRYSVEEFCDIVLSKDLSRSSAGAPAQGLYMSDVSYPDEIFLNR